MSGTTTRWLTKPMASANQFLGQLLNSNMWNHIFLYDEAAGCEIFPHETSFCFEKCITRSGSSQLEGDDIVVHFFQYNGGSSISVGMKKVKDGNTENWTPNSVAVEILLLDQSLVARNGSERYSIPVIKVWKKL